MSLHYASTGMAYWEEGHGPLLVFVHGAFSDYRVWSPQIAALAHCYRAMSVSLRGYTPTQNLVAHASAQHHADDLVAFLRDDLIGPVALIGHSRGARIALDVAARLPVDKLILFEPGGVAEPDFYGPSTPPTSSPDIRTEVKQLVSAGESDKALELYVDHGHGPGTWQRLPGWYRAVLTENASTIDMMITDSTVKLSRRICSNINCPIYLIGGKDSPHIFGRAMDVIETCSPIVQRVSVAGNHFANVCETKNFNIALDAFLRDARN